MAGGGATTPASLLCAVPRGGSGAPAQLRQARRPKHGGGRGLRRGDGAMAAQRGSDGVSKLDWRQGANGRGDLAREQEI